MKLTFSRLRVKCKTQLQRPNKTQPILAFVPEPVLWCSYHLPFLVFPPITPLRCLKPRFQPDFSLLTMVKYRVEPASFCKVCCVAQIGLKLLTLLPQLSEQLRLQIYHHAWHLLEFFLDFKYIYIIQNIFIYILYIYM